MSSGSVRHSLEYLAFRVARATWSLPSEPLAVRLGGLAGLLAGSVLRIRRRDVDQHLALAFPDRPRGWRNRVARGSYRHLGREAAMLFRMGGWPRERVLACVTFRGLEDLRAAAESGTGAVLLTGHIGNWEVAGAAIAASGVGLDVVGKGMANRRFQEDLFRLRERLGMAVIDMVEAPKAVLRALDGGRVVAMLADQNAHQSDLFIPFFGRQAATARGAALFAIRKDVPVFLGITLREAGWRQRYVVSFRQMRFQPTGDVEADTRALLTAYAQGLEDAIRQAPDQYFWQHRRWKTRPSEELPSRG